MNKIKNKVIVWSIDDFNTLGLMRELGSTDLDMLFLVKGKADFATKSRFCKAYHEVETNEMGRDFLIETFCHEESKPILIISSDDIITYVDQHKEAFDKYFITPGSSKKGNIEKYNDKNNMTRLAEQIGILCPKSCYVKWNSDISKVDYPCLIKPSHETPGHFNEFKIKICKTENELKRTLRLVRRDSEFILQQYIPHKENVLIYGGRMMNGETVIAGAFIRDRWADSGSSSHGYITGEIPKSIDAELIAKYLETIDYYGLFSVEYGIWNCMAYFFEFNFRNDGTSHYFYQAGANIPLAYVYSCAHKPLSEVQTRCEVKQYFIDEVFDYENVILHKTSKKQWKKDMSTATIFKYYDSNDPVPYTIVRKKMVKQIIQDILLKRFRLYIVYVLDRLGLKK